MILFLYGPDTYRAHQKVQDISAGYQKVHANAVHVRSLDCANSDVEAFKTEIESISMFEKKKLLILKNALHSPDFEIFLNIHKEKLLRSDRHIVVLWETEEIKAKTRNTLYQWLKKHVKCQEFVLLSPTSLKTWVQKEFQGYGVKVDAPGIEYLARAVGNNLWQLAGEVKKIAAFKGLEPNGMVRKAEIALLVRTEAATDVFTTIDSMARRDRKKALELLSKHFIKGDSPHYLLVMFLYQFRILIEIRDMMDREISLSDMAQKSGLHPYVLKKGLRVAQHFSFADLRMIYKKLFLLDTAFKTGRVEPEGALTNFVMSL